MLKAPPQPKTPMSRIDKTNIRLCYAVTIVSVAEANPANGFPSIAPEIKFAAVRSIAENERV